jgi:hypothetical protein
MSKATVMIERHQDLHEMARIGTIGGLDFRIYSEPLGNPSFHLVSSEYEIVVEIRDLKILEVINPGTSKFSFKKGEILSGNLKKAVLSFMTKKHTDRMLYLWNRDNPKFKIELKDIEWYSDNN